MKSATRHVRTAEHISWFPVAQNIMLNAPSRQRRFFASKPSYDPLARRPNQICDPYGQGGKRLPREDAQGLLATVEKDWRLVPEDSPTGLVRDFHHKDFMDGSQFLAKIAVVAHMNNHYPSIHLERKLLPKSWQVATTVKCSTPTLEGLSYNDFYIAMVSRSIP
jgi:pterin-4a-carbinolamine dehydratase